MDALDFASDALLGYDFNDNTNRNNTFSQSYPPYLSAAAWSLPLDAEAEMTNMIQQSQQAHQTYPSSNRNRPNATASTTPLQTTGLGLGYTQNMNNDAESLLQPSWQFQYNTPAPQAMMQHGSFEQQTYNSTFETPLQTSPVDYMPATTAEQLQQSLVLSGAMGQHAYMSMAGPMESMAALANPLEEYTAADMFFMNQRLNAQAYQMVQGSLPGSSPTDSYLEARSLSSSDNGWAFIDPPSSRQSFDNFGDRNNHAVFNPSQTLHHRTESDSSSSEDHPPLLSGPYEELPFPMHSPVSEGKPIDYSQAHASGYNIHMPHQDCDHDHYDHSPTSSAPSSVVSPSSAVAIAGSASTSPTASSSPPLRRRKSPSNANKTTKPVIKKGTVSIRKDVVAEKKVGRRRGPLRPDQRQQAHEIRKLRACLRCKFLKKTCDKGDPCAGCRPSHARLWQVPCTRIDIKDIGYFMKDWKADFERHVSREFSVNNIQGFSQMERTLYITHGYGHYLAINAREVFVRDDKCFGIDWVETIYSPDEPKEFEVPTAKLSAGMEGVSTARLSDYLDQHLDGGFESFIDNYFEGTKFLTEMLKTAHRYYLRERLPVIRKALKLVLAYNLTLHVTMVEGGLSEEEAFVGRIENEDSKYHGKTMAPVMINFQVKCAMADMWRELQKDILEELSSLYSSVYSGEKLKNWPTIFMLATILLAVWEEMQFDCHYRVPDEKAVAKFCTDMESTPVGVIVGLFQAISQKLPGFQEWDSARHHQLLGSNAAVCEALDEVKAHVNKYGEFCKSCAA